MANPSPLFYQNIVPLNAQTHKNLYLDKASDFKFAKKTNSLYIAHVEFLKASKEYPIVFAADKDKNLYPVVLLGLDRDQNLFVDSKGKWLGSYIPAYVRRYPFILATNPANDGNYTICIDDKFAGLNTSRKGEKLFDKDGQHTEQLKQSIEFLREYNRHTQVTTAFCSKLKELNVLEPMKLNMKTNEGKEISMGGFMGVSRKKLKALPSDVVADLFSNDFLELIYLHLASLSNVESLMHRID